MSFKFNDKFEILIISSFRSKTRQSNLSCPLCLDEQHICYPTYQRKNQKIHKYSCKIKYFHCCIPEPVVC